MMREFHSKNTVTFGRFPLDLSDSDCRSFVLDLAELKIIFLHRAMTLDLFLITSFQLRGNLFMASEDRRNDHSDQ